MSIKAFAVVGYKNTGKTTLVCRLVAELKRRGYRVGTLKHDAHDFRMDHEGTDTFKHRQAGADLVAIASPEKWVVQGWANQPPSLEEMLQKFADVDLVIVEGYKQGPLPKIVIADRQGTIFQQETLENVVSVAVAGDASLLAPSGVPVYDRNEIDSFVKIIQQTLAL